LKQEKNKLKKKKGYSTKPESYFEMQNVRNSV